MECGFEQKTTEDKLIENAINLEIEVIKLQRENESLKKRIRLLEDLKETTDKVVNLPKIIIDSEEKSNNVTIGDFVSRQRRIFQNKVNHGFNTTNIYQEARYILEEVAELMRAIEKNDRENMIEELADIVIFSYGCAEVARLGDLDAKIFEKMAVNESREYHQTLEGDFVKTNSNEDKVE